MVKRDDDKITIPYIAVDFHYPYGLPGRLPFDLLKKLDYNTAVLEKTGQCLRKGRRSNP